MTKTVLFFGGYGSTQAEVGAWAKSAYDQQKDYIFNLAYALISKSNDENQIVRDEMTTITNVVRQINSNTDEYIIVGHSSGCAVANRIAEYVQAPKRIELVVLDGFVPLKSLQLQVKTTCWSASNGSRLPLTDPTGLLSRNYSAMKDYGLNFKEFIHKESQTSWSLHFSLINLNVPTNLSQETFITKGYDNCKANLMFLEKE